MPTLSAYDGTLLAYHVSGDGSPVICLPGGPMQDSAYLGDLGGLTAYQQLVRLDLRGTGQSATPDDPASYRCDRLVDDVDALLDHLDLDEVALLGHSAGTNLAVLYVQHRPDRVNKLALVTPSTFAVGVTVSGDVRRETAQLRRDEPWFPSAYAALETIVAGAANADDAAAITPFFYGHWNDVARAHSSARDEQQNEEAAAVFAAEGAFVPDATRAALASFERPVLIVAGEVDLNSPPLAMAEIAELFPNARLVVQPAAGHYPWLDDADTFVTTIAAFFSRAETAGRVRPVT